MSINFRDDINEQTEEMIKEFFGEKTIMDKKTALIKPDSVLLQSQMKAIANAAGQVATFEMHDSGFIKTLADGSRYRVTEKGWKKIEDEDFLK